MRQLHRRFGAILGLIVASSLVAIPSSVTAQDEIADSLCGLFSRKEVRSALDTKSHKARPEHDLFYCGWNTTEFGEALLPFNIGWSDYSLDSQRLLMQDSGYGPATDETVGGRRALYQGGPGNGRLLVELDQGVLDMSIVGRADTDWKPVLLHFGELAAARGADLVPMGPPADPAILALLPTGVGDVTFVTKPDYVQRIYSDKGRRRALRDALQAVGKTNADVSMVSGFDLVKPISVAAFRVAGADAADLTRAALASGDPNVKTVPEVVANGEVGYIPRQEGANPTFVTYVYPKDDIVWTVTGTDALAGQILAALPGAPAPVPVPTPTPAPTPDISTPEGYLASLLPATLGGEALTVQGVYPAEGFMASAAQKQFKAVLKEQGKKIFDLWIGQAGTGSGTAVLAFRIVGGEAAPLEDLILKFLKDAGQVDKNAEPSPTDIAGKSARALKIGGRDGYLYPQDEVLWVMNGPDEALLRELITAMP